MHSDHRACAGCGSDDETVTVHVAYPFGVDTYNRAIESAMSTCRESENNRIRVVVDDVPPGVTIPRWQGSDQTLSPNTVWSCADLLED